MAKKKGRPTDNPAHNQLRIRLTDDELNALNECCDVLKRNKTEIVRQGIAMIHAGLERKK